MWTVFRSSWFWRSASRTRVLVTTLIHAALALSFLSLVKSLSLLFTVGILKNETFGVLLLLLQPYKLQFSPGIAFYNRSKNTLLLYACICTRSRLCRFKMTCPWILRTITYIVVPPTSTALSLLVAMLREIAFIIVCVRFLLPRKWIFTVV